MTARPCQWHSAPVGHTLRGIVRAPPSGYVEPGMTGDGDLRRRADRAARSGDQSTVRPPMGLARRRAAVVGRD